MKRAKRFSEGDEVEYFGSAIKSSSEKDYEPIISNEKTGSTGSSEPTAKPASKPTSKPASAKAQKTAPLEDNSPTKANAAKMDEAAAEMRRESNRGAEKSTSKAETSSKSAESVRGVDGKTYKKTESSRPDIGGAIGRGISGFFSSIRERGKKSNPDAYAKGGSVSSASSRGDGIAQRGKTRGKMC
jgi:hypothetical protein